MVDADVLFAGSASPSDRSASTVVLRLSDLTLIDGLASQKVVDEAERNLTAKVPAALGPFRELVAACLRIVDDPTADEVLALGGQADPRTSPSWPPRSTSSAMCS
ncbi:hypothetical protein [Rubrivirga sp. IMCC43871]|uniref:hypothetical protein n=1 Tax=Rubrivirga sp. IMCC43871 TaxID=3391575 RepID=UPI00398FEA8B